MFLKLTLRGYGLQSPLMGWSLLPNSLRPFWDLLWSPNLGIKTWICRLILLIGQFFQAWGSLTSLKSQNRDPQLKVPPGDLCSGFLRSEINPSTSAGFEPAGSRGKYVTPRPPKPTTSQRVYVNWSVFVHLIYLDCFLEKFVNWSYSYSH